MYGAMKFKPYRRLRRIIRKPWVAAKNALADAGYPLTANDRKLTALRDCNKGRRCFVIGNGPSLRLEDLDRMKREVTFAANRIFLAFESTDWRPTYYFVLDRVVAEDNLRAIQGLNLDKYAVDLLRPVLGRKGFSYFEVPGGSRYDVREGLDVGATVISAMVQFAYYMGCSEIYLVGVDFDFVLPHGTDIRKAGCEEILVSSGERNHFHSDYRSAGERWTYPRLDVQRAFFTRQRAFMRSREGREVLLNASRRSKLEVLPRVDFDSLFDHSQNDIQQ